MQMTRRFTIHFRSGRPRHRCSLLTHDVFVPCVLTSVCKLQSVDDDGVCSGQEERNVNCLLKI